jgi:hypothetical protein
VNTKSSGEKSNCTYMGCGQKNGKVLLCISDKTKKKKKHQTGDEGEMKKAVCPVQEDRIR